MISERGGCLPGIEETGTGPGPGAAVDLDLGWGKGGCEGIFETEPVSVDGAAPAPNSEEEGIRTAVGALPLTLTLTLILALA